MLENEFEVRSRVLHTNARDIRLFQNPFAVDLYEAPPSVQLELAELQNCDALRDTFQSAGLADFYAAIMLHTYPNIKKHGIKICPVFGNTYIFEQTFSRLKLLKSQKRIRLRALISWRGAGWRSVAHCTQW